MDARTFVELLDKKIARLRIEYEQYFVKALKREPAQFRAEIEKMILLYSDKNISNTSLKFRFNSIVSKYNSYRQYWTRVLRAIEDGTYVRKAEGADAGMSNALKPGGPMNSNPALEDSPPEEASYEPETPRAGDGQAEGKKTGEGDLEDIYRSYIEARKKCNEPVEGISFEALARTIERNKKQVENKYKTGDIEIKVYIKDNKAKLAITPKKSSKP